MIRSFISVILIMPILFVFFNAPNFSIIQADNNEMIHIPIRWCALEGTPAVDAPHFPSPYGGVNNTTESILDTRLKMINDNIYNRIGISFYSLHHNLSEPYNTIPIVKDPNTEIGEKGNWTSIGGNQTEGGQMVGSCNSIWQDRLQNSTLDGLVMLNMRLFNFVNGTRHDIFGASCCLDVRWSEVAVSDNKFTSASMDGGLGYNVDKLDKTLGHEVGHGLGLSDIDNNPNALMYENLKRPNGTMSGIDLSEWEISKMRNNSLLIPGVSVER